MTTAKNTPSSLVEPQPLAKLLQTNQAGNTWSQIAWVSLRVGVGLLMIHNGLDKLADIQKFADGVVTFIGLPFPVFFAYCAAYVEVMASILLALGLLTRLNAAALLGTMLVAIYFHLKGNGLQVAPLETASLYALCYLFFLVNGGGALSIDSVLWQKMTGTKS
jgi:putative oxidoreductase